MEFLAKYDSVEQFSSWGSPTDHHFHTITYNRKIQAKSYEDALLKAREIRHGLQDCFSRSVQLVFLDDYPVSDK